MKEVNSLKANKAVGPYSQAIISNNMVYISGQIPIKDGILENDYKKATNIIMTNIKYILQEANSSLDNLVKINIFIKDINYFDIVNEEYKKYFSNIFPARSLVEVSSLPKGAIMEIEGVAEICK